MAPAKAKSGRQSKAAAANDGAKAPALVDALAAAAWVEADRALAEALAHIDELEHTRDPRRRRDLLALLSQALTRAARKRGLTRFGTTGAEEHFDPSRHELRTWRGEPPVAVEVVARGVARGHETLAKARVRTKR